MTDASAVAPRLPVTLRLQLGGLSEWGPNKIKGEPASLAMLLAYTPLSVCKCQSASSVTLSCALRGAQCMPHWAGLPTSWPGCAASCACQACGARRSLLGRSASAGLGVPVASVTSAGASAAHRTLAGAPNAAPGPFSALGPALRQPASAVTCPPFAVSRTLEFGAQKCVRFGLLLILIRGHPHASTCVIHLVAESLSQTPKPKSLPLMAESALFGRCHFLRRLKDATSDLLIRS
jgi:hypothetical protein